MYKKSTFNVNGVTIVRARIGQIAAGRFNGTKPILAFSEETIDLSVIEGRSEEGSFVIESTNQIKIRGIVYSTNPRMECLNPHFEGEKVRIRYQFNSKGLVEGDACEGSFVIVCNQIEYSLSFCARITKLYAETSVGVIKNLDDFTKLAQNNWTEAYHLFYNRNFLNIISEDMVVENMIYRGIMAAKPSSRNMEEFLVGVHKKKPVSIKVDKTKEEFAASAENQSGSFEITRMNWGYAEIHVRTDCEFIKLSRQALTFDDFIGKTYVYSYIIDNERMHAGNNFGRIFIECVHQTFTIEVAAHANENKSKNKSIRNDIKKSVVGVTQLYQSYRLKRIVTGLWANETIGELKHLHALCPKEPLYELMKAQAYIINRQRQEAEWILNDFKREFSDKKAPVWGYYLYLKTLLEREPSYVDRMTHEIELIFYENPDSSLLFWVLLFLREQYFDNDAGKLKDIRYWILNGCSSPFMYVEAYYLMWKDPYLLKELGTFELRILGWAVKNKALSKELAEQIFEVVELSSGFEKKVFDLLTAAYEVCPSDEYVGIICSYLIKGQQNDVRYHEWFEKAIELKLRITGVYESFLITMEDRQISSVPDIVQMYFQYDNNLPYRKLAVLYNNIIAAKTKKPEIYHKYRSTMTRFAMEQAKQSHMDDNLAVLYDDMLELGFINDELAVSLSDIIFSYKLIVFDRHIVRAVIYQSQMENPQIVPVIDQTAYFQLFSDRYVILFEDEKGYRYVDSISYRMQRLMNPEKYLNKCLEHAPNELSYIAFHLRNVTDYSGLKESDSIYFKQLICNKEFSDAYRDKMIAAILKYYRIHDKEKDIKQLLQSIDCELLSAATRRYMIEMLVENHMFEKAYDIVQDYGIDQMSAVSKVTLCENALAASQEEDEFMLSLSASAFMTGKYNDTMLKYLCDNYSGPTDMMIDLWNAAKRFSVSSVRLDERIIEQAVYTDRDLTGISEIFMSYYDKGGNDMLVLAYISVLANNYMISNITDCDFIFDIIENRYECRRTLNDACKLALLKHMSVKSQISSVEYEIEDALLDNYICHNMYFDFFARLDYRLVQKYYLYDKVFLQYMATEENCRVVLHYSRDEDGDDFTEEELQPVYGGIYVKTFVMFFGEMIRYYITQESDGRVLIKESSRLICNNIYGGADHSRYNLTNEIIISNTLLDDETFCNNVSEYRKKDSLTKQIFTLM